MTKKQTFLSLLLTLFAMLWAGAGQAQTAYGLWIAGTQVSSENCNNLSVIDGVTGTVKYDNATQTLTLDNATINNTIEEENGAKNTGIFNHITGLTIRLIGNNTITSKKGVGLQNVLILNLTGKGKLTVKGSTTAGKKENQRGIYNQGDISVKDCSLEVSAGIYGLCQGRWKFEHCNVRAKGGGDSSDEHAGSIGKLWDDKPRFIGCNITAPKEILWKEVKDQRATYFSLQGKDHKMYTDWVTIEPVYDLYLAGQQVTRSNCDNLSVLDGVSGMVKYDNATKTLTLENATISNTAADDEYNGSGSGLYNDLDGLTIRLVGNNTITSEKGIGLQNDDAKSLSLTGEGRLTVKGAATADSKDFSGAIANGGHITVSRCTLEASAGVHGLVGGEWKFDRCNVRTKGGGISGNSYTGSISWLWKQPEFVGCNITELEGAQWKKFKDSDNTYYSLFGGNEMVATDWVTIAPIPTAVGSLPTDTATPRRGIYTLQGLRLSGSFEHLPKGIYIVDGKKVVKQ